MKRFDLERFLEAGKSFGFVKSTQSDNYIGWVSLEKRKINERLDYLFEDNELPDDMRKERGMTAKRPYVVRVCELKKEVYESEGYPQNDDYLMNEIYRFADLSEVQNFLEAFHLVLDEIKWLSEIPTD